MIDYTVPYSFWEIVCHDASKVGFTIDPKSPLLSRVRQLRKAMRHKPGFACVVWLRIDQHFIRKSWRGQFRIRMWRQYRFANDISPYANIGSGLYLPHPVDVTIGGNVKIGKNATIFNGVTIVGLDTPNLPLLGDGVTVYTGAKIIKGVTIGNNAVIGALTLCNKDVPIDSVMYGIPPNVTIKAREKE